MKIKNQPKYFIKEDPINFVRYDRTNMKLFLPGSSLPASNVEIDLFVKSNQFNNKIINHILSFKVENDKN